MNIFRRININIFSVFYPINFDLEEAQVMSQSKSWTPQNKLEAGQVA